MPEFQQRRRALAGQLAPLKADAILVSFLPNIRYLTGYTGSNGMLLLFASGAATFFTDPRYRIQAAAEVDCRIKISTGPLLPDVMALIARKRIRRLGFEKSRLGYEPFDSAGQDDGNGPGRGNRLPDAETLGRAARF